jgi:predicted SAM-dependent methyltransferase
MQSSLRRPLRDRWPYRLVLKVAPLPVVQLLRYESRLAMTRLRSRGMRRAFRGAHDLLINVGCGYMGRAGWVNVDGVRLPGVTCVFDSRTGLPFPDNSARAIFSEHFLEHISYSADAPRFLSGCARVLRPDGILRLVVPDAEKYLHAYISPGWDEMRKLRGCGGFATKMEVLNEVFRQGIEHKFAYDYETLERLLLRCGFRKVERKEYGQSDLDVLRIDQYKRAAESLYVEATK